PARTLVVVGVPDQQALLDLLERLQDACGLPGVAGGFGALRQQVGRHQGLAPPQTAIRLRGLAYRVPERASVARERADDAADPHRLVHQAEELLAQLVPPPETGDD